MAVKTEPTMQDVARVSGYSRAAVSMALRGDRTIPESTRRHIRNIAQKLGYRTNPLVSALMILQRQRRPLHSATTAIAYLTQDQKEGAWRKHWYYRSMFDSAVARAAEIGFRLEEFSLTAPGMTPARLREILHVRGIHAIIVAPLPRGETHLDFDLAGIAAVGLGMSVKTPVIERVASDHFQAAALAVERCAALGYRRVGFVLSEETSSRLDNRWLGGFRFGVAQHRLEPLPPLMTPRAEQLPAAMPAWIRAHRPDVVILGNVEQELLAAVPTTIGLVSLGVDGRDSSLAGIDQNWTVLGRVTAEHVIAKLYTNSYDPLHTELLHLVAGTWVTGQSAPGPRRKRPSLR